MAEGGALSGRSEKCQPCFRKGRDNVVVKFCGQCQLSFCLTCLEKHDDLFDHQEQHDGDSSGDVGSSTISEECTAFCGVHKMPITLYCNSEDTFGCKTCMDNDHKHCGQVTYLPVYAKSLLKDIDVAGLVEQLDKMVQELKNIKLKQQSLLPGLDEDRERILKTVNNHHSRLLAKFNAIFRSTTEAIDQKFETLRTELETNIQHVEMSLSELESSRSRLQQFQDKLDQKFIEVRKCQKNIKMSETVFTEAADNLKIRGMDAVIDERFDDLLIDLKHIATVIRRGPIKVKKKYLIDVSVKEDTTACNITASCILHDNSILLVDVANNRLKRLDSETQRITDMYRMENRPIGVCCIDEEEVAITTVKNQLIFFAIFPKLRLTRTLTFSHDCGYVASFKDRLFITDIDKRLYVYNMQGSLLRTFKTDTSGNYLFSTARHIVVNDTGDKLFVTDWENGLVTLNRRWMTVDRVDNLKSSGTRGVCLDDVGGAFVCGYTTNKVASVSPEGKHVIDVLTESDGLLKPKSVCFEVTRRRLFISQEGRNKMIVCDMI